jgi:hypothetical protein
MLDVSISALSILTKYFMFSPIIIFNNIYFIAITQFWTVSKIYSVFNSLPNVFCILNNREFWLALGKEKRQNWEPPKTSTSRVYCP